MISERFASTSTYQHYDPSPLRQIVGDAFLARVFTAAQAVAGSWPSEEQVEQLLRELQNADYIDVDFDAIGNAITFVAYWSPVDAALATTSDRRASRRIRKSRPNDRVEVGVLHPEVAKEPEELSLGGFLTVLGETDHPSMTSLFTQQLMTNNI